MHNICSHCKQTNKKIIQKINIYKTAAIKGTEKSICKLKLSRKKIKRLCRIRLNLALSKEYFIKSFKSNRIKTFGDYIPSFQDWIFIPSYFFFLKVFWKLAVTFSQKQMHYTYWNFAYFYTELDKWLNSSWLFLERV